MIMIVRGEPKYHRVIQGHFFLFLPSALRLMCFGTLFLRFSLFFSLTRRLCSFFYSLVISDSLSPLRWSSSCSSSSSSSSPYASVALSSSSCWSVVATVSSPAASALVSSLISSKPSFFVLSSSSASGSFLAAKAAAFYSSVLIPTSFLNMSS